MTTGNEISHLWEDRSGTVRSLFCHEKLPYEPICLPNILIIFNSQEKVALRTVTVTLVARTTQSNPLYQTSSMEQKTKSYYSLSLEKLMAIKPFCLIVDKLTTENNSCAFIKKKKS